MQLDDARLHQLVAQLATRDVTMPLQALATSTAATLQAAVQAQTAVTVSVVDAAGRLIFCYRMPTAILASLILSQKKAYSAVAMNSTTAALQPQVQPGQDLYQLETATDGAIVTFGGGVPLYNTQQQLIGGVGVSGAPRAELDHQLAQYFAKQFAQQPTDLQEFH